MKPFLMSMAAILLLSGCVVAYRPPLYRHSTYRPQEIQHHEHQPREYRHSNHRHPEIRHPEYRPPKHRYFGIQSPEQRPPARRPQNHPPVFLPPRDRR